MEPEPHIDATRQDATQRDTSRYSVKVPDAAQMLADAGVPRSPRTVQRFCKNGNLDCQMVDLEKDQLYLITQKSIDRRIQELKQIRLFSRTPHPDMTRHDATERDTSRHDEPQEQSIDSELRKENKNLKAENIDLKITNGVKTVLLERAHGIEDENQKLGRWVGRLEGRLLQLGGKNEELLEIEQAATRQPDEIHNKPESGDNSPVEEGGQ